MSTNQFNEGDRVRINLPGGVYDQRVGRVVEKIYDQHINTETGKLVDEWSWVYRVDIDLMTGPIVVVERSLACA